MKKVLKQMISTICFVLLLFNSYTCLYARAVEVNKTDINISNIERSSLITVNTSWKTVLQTNSGFSRTITISFTATNSNDYCNVRFLGKNGNVVWTKNNAIQGNGIPVSFWCGADVYKIQICTSTGTGKVKI